jgi:hypothetical protein
MAKRQVATRRASERILVKLTGRHWRLRRRARGESGMDGVGNSMGAGAGRHVWASVGPAWADARSDVGPSGGRDSNGDALAVNRLSWPSDNRVVWMASGVSNPPRRVNVGRGLRRVLAVLVAVYWLAALADGARAYQDAASGAVRPELAYVGMADGRVFVIRPGDASVAFGPSACIATLPGLRAELAARYSGARVKDGACTAAGIASAQNHIRFVEGRTALAGELLYWFVAFAILSIIGLVIRWVWRGFSPAQPR